MMLNALLNLLHALEKSNEMIKEEGTHDLPG